MRAVRACRIDWRGSWSWSYFSCLFSVSVGLEEACAGVPGAVVVAKRVRVGWGLAQYVVAAGGGTRAVSSWKPIGADSPSEGCATPEFSCDLG